MHPPKPPSIVSIALTADRVGGSSTAWSVVTQATVLLSALAPAASYVKPIVNLSTQKVLLTVSHSIALTCGSRQHSARTALLSKFFPITTPLFVNCWASILYKTNSHNHLYHVLNGLYYAFSLGLEDFTINSTFSPPTHYCNPSYHMFVLEKYNKKHLLGHVSKEFDLIVAECLLVIIGQLLLMSLSVLPARCMS